MKSRRMLQLSLTVICVFMVIMPLIAQDTPPTDGGTNGGTNGGTDGGTDSATDTPIATAPPEDTTPFVVERPEPFASLTEGGVTVEYLFETIPQGGIGVVYLYGEGVVGANAVFRDKTISFFEALDDGYYAIISVSMDQAIRDYPINFYAIMQDESRIAIEGQIVVSSGSFIRETFELNGDRAYLIDPEVERAEFARLDSVFVNSAPERLWLESEAFQLPIASDLTSRFGSVRVLNDTVQTRHTGWDLRASIGTPVMAMGAGRVAFAGRLDIRGNYVVIDHGNGVFSGYAHFSQIHVTRGQSVTKGQIIGMTGNTGRSNGPHLHWEMAVHGEWVDSVQFLQSWIP